MRYSGAGERLYCRPDAGKTVLAAAESGQALRKLHHPQRATLHRPVVAIGPLQNYCVDPDFATVAAATMFGDAVWRRLLNMIGLPDGFRPVRNPVSKPPGRSSTL